MYIDPIGGATSYKRTNQKPCSKYEHMLPNDWSLFRRIQLLVSRAALDGVTLKFVSTALLTRVVQKHSHSTVPFHIQLFTENVFKCKTNHPHFDQ